MEALEDDEGFEESGLSEKLEHVLGLLPDNSNPYVFQQDVVLEE